VAGVARRVLDPGGSAELSVGLECALAEHAYHPPRAGWGPLSQTEQSKWPHICPDVGSAVCLTCTLGERIAIAECQLENCWFCCYEFTCPCSRTGWERRQRRKDKDERRTG
jgi:hypothetical protein